MKKPLLTGFIILMPLALTLMIIFFLFDFFTTPFLPIVSSLLSQLEVHYHFTLPVELALFISRLFALIFLCIFILLLGALARKLLIKKIFEWTHALLVKIPFIKTIYKVSRDIFSALFSNEGKKAFKDPLIVSFPHPPSYALGFHAGEVAPECQEKIKTPLISVFVPTAPHPISGFLLLLPQNEVHKVDMTKEEALKFLVSCGMVQPAGEKVDLDEIS